MADVIGPLLVAAGFGFYMLLVTQLGRFSRVPWEALGIGTLGVLHALAHAARSPGAGSALSAALTLALFGGLLWFFFGYSMYGAREDRPRVGDPFPTFRLPTSDGAEYDLAAHRGKRRLLIFYRGSW
jgi:hypothetical protein